MSQASRNPCQVKKEKCSGACRLGGEMAHFAGCASLSGVWLWCRSDANSVQNRLKRVRSVQFACPIGSAASSFSSVRGRGAKCLISARSVQFTNSSGPDEQYTDTEDSGFAK